DFGILGDFRFPRLRLGFGAFQIHQRGGHFLPVAALHAIEAHTVAFHFVFADDLVGAVTHVQLEVGRPRARRQRRQEQNKLAHTSIDYSTAPPVSWFTD